MTATPAVRRFRKRPVVIEAVHWDGTAGEATAVIGWVLANGGTARYHDDPPALSIDTLEGTMTAPPGSWVIRGVAGEFYRCEPAIFERTYEQATSPVSVTVTAAGRGMVRVDASWAAGDRGEWLVRMQGDDFLDAAVLAGKPCWSWTGYLAPGQYSLHVEEHEPAPFEVTS